MSCKKENLVSSLIKFAASNSGFSNHTADERYLILRMAFEFFKAIYDLFFSGYATKLYETDISRKL